jgi:hypothetical protein
MEEEIAVETAIEMQKVDKAKISLQSEIKALKSALSTERKRCRKNQAERCSAQA